MNYLELIQRFWDFNQKFQIGSTGISMYLYLLKIGYDNNRCDFQISDVAVSKALGLTRKTVKIIKEKLKNFGLIEFQTRNGLPCYYKLLVDYPLQIALLEKTDKVNIRKSSVSPKSENEDIQSSYQSIAPIIDNKDIPTFEEFIDYAQTLEMYESKLEFGIKEKYETWLNNGWQNSSDRLITNWKSSLKSILPYIKNSNIDGHPSLTKIPVIKRPKNLDSRKFEDKEI